MEIKRLIIRHDVDIEDLELLANRYKEYIEKIVKISSGKIIFIRKEKKYKYDYFSLINNDRDTIVRYELDSLREGGKYSESKNSFLFHYYFILFICDWKIYSG